MNNKVRKTYISKLKGVNTYSSDRIKLAVENYMDNLINQSNSVNATADEIPYPVYDQIQVFFNKYDKNNYKLDDNLNIFNHLEIFIYLGKSSEPNPYDVSSYNFSKIYATMDDWDSMYSDLFKLIDHEMNIDDKESADLTLSITLRDNIENRLSTQMINEDITSMMFYKYKNINLDSDALVEIAAYQYTLKSIHAKFLRLSVKGNTIFNIDTLTIDESVDIDDTYNNQEGAITTVLDFKVLFHVDIHKIITRNTVELKFLYNNQDNKQYPYSYINIATINIAGFNNPKNTMESVLIHKFLNVTISEVVVDPILEKANQLKFEICDTVNITSYTRHYISRLDGYDIAFRNVGEVAINKIDMSHKGNTDSQETAAATMMRFMYISSDDEAQIYPKISLNNISYITFQMPDNPNQFDYTLITNKCTNTKAININRANLYYNILSSTYLVSELNIVDSTMILDKVETVFENINTLYFDNLQLNSKSVNFKTVGSIGINDSRVNITNSNKGRGFYVNPEEKLLSELSIINSYITMDVNSPFVFNFHDEYGITYNFENSQVKCTEFVCKGYIFNASYCEFITNKLDISSAVNSPFESNLIKFTDQLDFYIKGFFNLGSLILSNQNNSDTNKVTLYIGNLSEITANIVSDDLYQKPTMLNIVNDDAYIKLTLDSYYKTVNLKNTRAITLRHLVTFYDVPDYSGYLMQIANNEFKSKNLKSTLTTDGGIKYVEYKWVYQ